MLGHILATYSRLLRPQVGDNFADRTLQEAMDNAREGYQRNPYSATTCSCYVAFLGWEGPEDELDVKSALEIQEEAVRINPSNAFAHSMLAQIYQVVGRRSEALDQIRLAKRLSPRDVNFSHFLSLEAFIHLSMGNWVSAMNLAQSAITLRPLNFYAHVTRIMSLYARDDLEGANAAARELLDVVPDFSAAMFWNVPLPDSLAPIASRLIESRQVTRVQAAVSAVLEELNSS
jgi:tetratricopeptide (TPR) repeat protein